MRIWERMSSWDSNIRMGIEGQKTVSYPFDLFDFIRPISIYTNLGEIGGDQAFIRVIRNIVLYCLRSPRKREAMRKAFDWP